MNIKVDAKGLKCPEPIMLLHKAIRESRHGDVIEVFATDPSTERDIDKFCEFLGHKLLKKEIDNDNFYYLVERRDKNIIES
jgi:tRNA 2-thiouridine synthesizing protein A|tara:strand:+ start:503 stop:745 length:243 start_codon:yes stop_codon:yes gene_type:complete